MLPSVPYSPPVWGWFCPHRTNGTPPGGIRLPIVVREAYIPLQGNNHGWGDALHKRARVMTLTQVSDRCSETGDDPVVTVGDLLAGLQDGSDVLGLLLPARVQGGEYALEVA